MDGGGRLIVLKAGTLTEARAEALQHFRSDGDVAVDDMVILEVKSMEQIDVAALTLAKEAEEQVLAKLRAEERDRAELARLKAKLGEG